jgi:hypothetical protein
MIRPGDDGWMQITNVSDCDSGDICNFKGRPYVTNNKGKTVMVGPDLSVDLVAARLSESDPYTVRLCLVESELLLVNMEYCNCDVDDDDDDNDDHRDAWIDVYSGLMQRRKNG